VVETHGASVVRLLLLSGHYRRPVDFAPQSIEAVRTSLGRLHKLIGPAMSEAGEPALAEVLARPVPPEAAKHRDAFCAAMDDDFNTAAALAELHALAALARPLAGAERDQVTRLLRDLGRLIGLFIAGDERDTQAGSGGGSAQLDAVMALVLDLRQQARAQRQFAVSDQIRAALTEAGIAVKDAKDGASWQLTGPAEAALTRALALVNTLRDQARTAKDFATSDRIRDALVTAGVSVSDGAAGAG
jgi:cysteinyl-tRNA synthetase